MASIRTEEDVADGVEGSVDVAPVGVNKKAPWIKGIAHWVEDGVAFVSVAFTWRIPEARELCLYYKEQGLRVRAGGPGTFTRGKLLADVAELGGSVPDAIVRHNPMATRASYGCPVGCWFCIVPKMDGKAFTYLPDFPVRPILCDDNLSALPADYQKHIVSRYVAEGVRLLDANSGFEPKTFTEDVYRLWKPILRGPWRFGFDEASEGDQVERAFSILKDEPPRRKQVYTMIGHEPFAVCMARIQRVIDLGGEPYAQPFLKLNALKKEPAPRHDWDVKLLRQVQRWVNRHLWRKCPDFKDYDASAKTNPRPAKKVTVSVSVVESSALTIVSDPSPQRDCEHCVCSTEEHGPRGCRTWYGDKNTGFRCSCTWTGVSERPAVQAGGILRSDTRRQALRTDWRTPEAVLDRVRWFFGGVIPLDPATAPENPTRALTFYDGSDGRDGLTLPWAASGVYVNPPYGKTTPDWMRKIAREATGSRLSDDGVLTDGPPILALLPANRTETSYGQEMMGAASAVCWVRKRLAFIDASTGRAVGGNPFASVLYGFNLRSTVRFHEAFKPLGLCWSVS